MSNNDTPLDLAWNRFHRQEEAVDGALALSHWLLENARPEPVMECLASDSRVIELDFSARATRLGALDLTEAGASEGVNRLIAEYGAGAALGRYAEDRGCYSSPQFLGEGQPRSTHLGVDVFVPAGTPVHAPFDAVVVVVALNDEHLDYGPTVILRHDLSGAPRSFFTLYGHLSMGALDSLSPGQKIKAGEVFAQIGDEQENGHWPPHLHVQVILDLLGETKNFVGVCAPAELPFWRQICPDPVRILHLPTPVASGVVLTS